MDVSKVNIKPFDGSNFNLWKWQIETYLIAAGLKKVIAPAEGQVITAEDENKFNLVLSQTMTREQLIHVVSIPKGKDKWQRLNDIHQSSSVNMVQSLYSEFFSLKPDKDIDMATYISRLMSIKVQLDQQDHKLKDDLIIGNILEKLPSQYATFVVSWQATAQAERTLANLTNRLLREEARITGDSNNADSSPSAFAA